MKFTSDRQRKAMFSRLAGLENFLQYDCNQFSRLSQDRIYIPRDNFSFGGMMGDAGLFGDESDEYSHTSKKLLPRPGLQPDNKCQLTLARHVDDNEEYDVDRIPKEILDKLGTTREELKKSYESHGFKILGNKRFSVIPGDRVLKLASKDIDYGPNFGVVKEIKDDRVLIKFDDTGNEVWYPEDIVITQRKINESVRKF